MSSLHIEYAEYGNKINTWSRADRGCVRQLIQHEIGMKQCILYILLEGTPEVG